MFNLKNNEKKPLSRIFIFMACGVAAALAVCLILFVFIPGAKTPESIAEDIFEAYAITPDADVLLKYCPVDFAELFDTDSDRIEEILKENKERTEQTTGNISYDFEVEDCRDLSNEYYEKLLEELRDKYGEKYVVKGSIDKAVSVSLKITYKGSDNGGKSDETGGITIDLIEIDKKWYIADNDFTEQMEILCKTYRY